MQKLYVILIICLSGVLYGQNIEQLLFDLPGVSFTQIETPGSYESAYHLMVKQPLDHSDHSKGYFYQKVYLSHKGFDNINVIVTQGYNINRNRITELATLVNGNQIDVEHRFFGESVPETMQYEYLNLQQQAADLHHINQLFKQIYTGKWISTGISKGGSTTIFYRYFYPSDVDASVPYVAPFTNSIEDQRIYDFLDNIGSEECRQKIKDFQIRMLGNRDKIIPLLRYYAMGARLEFDYLNIEKAFEYAILEYPFAFWQGGLSCQEIPMSYASLDDDLMYFISVDPLSLFSDQLIDYFGSHYYQAASQMGYYGYKISDFNHLLKALPIDQNPLAVFPPNKMNVQFDGSLLQKANKWLAESGNQFIYIYGALDTWSACAVNPSNHLQAKKFVLEDKHHYNARIESMTPSEKQAFIDTLEQYLNVKLMK